ncbi:MAG: DegV family protein [Peptostreptococcaceae bacterium]|nr:DegV family protein [Peptostreptococcaceae bacterium]
MQKIGILVDTTSDLDLEIQNEKNIKIIALQIIFNDGRAFRDKFEITYDEMIAALDTYEAKTSLPTIQDTVDALEAFIAEGYTHVITMTLSDSLSGTFGMVKNTCDLYADKLQIAHIDTRSVTWGIGHVALVAADMIEQGKSFDEIVQYAEEQVHKRDIFFAVETLKYLIRGGRVSKLSGTIGEALDIKPILTLAQDGKLVAKDKVRGRKKSLAKLVEFIEEAKAGRQILKTYVLHGAREEDAQMLKEKLSAVTDAPIEIKHLGTLVSVHAGGGLVGVFVMYA